MGQTRLGKRVRSSARIRSRNGFSVLVTEAAVFIGTHVSITLKRHRDVFSASITLTTTLISLSKGLVKLYLKEVGLHVEGDINEVTLLKKVFIVAGGFYYLAIINSNKRKGNGKFVGSRTMNLHVLWKRKEQRGGGVEAMVIIVVVAMTMRM
ncbi:hypothetical protein L6452_42580 [Arctium lappa]|uniref:Uncharacterized protein n=1 Tax=Arctium lappa TaxID=4217 RepID=A0ACB8XKD7_ARCLA|nr:hypothetical protein L6452_42580 [Arctium lappa]